MEYECPICGYLNKDLDDCLPKLACDTREHECGGCEKTILIGWIAEVEVRGVKNDN